MKRLCIILVGMLFFVSSCSEEVEQVTPVESLEEDVIFNNVSQNKNLRMNTLYNDKYGVVREFAFAFAAAVAENVELRNLIKSKALEMFDADYEILFFMIKDEELSKNLTVGKLVSKYLPNSKIMKDLEDFIPTLTISVPVLPEDSFSAEKWNTATELPYIAIRLEDTNDVPIISSEGREELISGKYVPSFPILVLKESERVISENSTEFRTKKTKEFVSKTGKKFKLTDDNLDGSKKSNNKNSRWVTTDLIDSKLITAYNTYINADGWQRDQIYYNITPNQQRGQFDNTFEERVAYLGGIGDPNAFYTKIVQPTTDPHADKHRANGNSQHWTDGFFEFKLIALINSKSGLGATLTKVFSVNPRDLFFLHYKRTSNNWFGQDWYELDYVTYPNSVPVDYNISLFKWDLQNISTQVKLTLYETDIATTITETFTNSAEFANNFEANLGFFEKVGLKFGGSAKTSNTQSYSVARTLNDDFLGDAVFDFSDKVINYSNGVVTDVKDYNFGNYCRLNIIPKR